MCLILPKQSNHFACFSTLDILQILIFLSNNIDSIATAKSQIEALRVDRFQYDDYDYVVDDDGGGGDGDDDRDSDDDDDDDDDEDDDDGSGGGGDGDGDGDGDDDYFSEYNVSKAQQRIYEYMKNIFFVVTDRCFTAQMLHIACRVL